MLNLKEEHSKFVKLYSFSSGATSPTNIKLVEEMTSHLDEEIFKNPNSKFLDPCAGTGTFGVVLHDRLLKYHNSKWIFENMIFMIDTSRVNCDLLKKLGFVNVYNEDFLNLKLDMKFDVIVGNPPYQDSEIKSGKNSSLWTKFIVHSESYINKNGYLLFVTPLSWIAPSETQKNKLKSVFMDNNLIYLDTNCKKYFNVASTFSYFLIKKDKNYKHTNINNEINENLNIPFLPKTINNITLEITKKIFNSFNECIDFSSSDRNDKFEKNGQYRVYDGNNFKQSNVLGKNYNIEKVIVNKPGYLNPRYDGGWYNTSGGNYWAPVESKIEADNIISFLDSNLGKNILQKLYKYSGYNSLGVLKSLPNVIKYNNWDTINPFKDVLKLTQEEIDYIENYVG